MNGSTRRGFLAMAGAGAVTGAAAVVAPAAHAASEDETLPLGARGRMAAYVQDVQKGEVLVMVDDQEVLVTDPKLVARLARSFARATRA